MRPALASVFLLFAACTQDGNPWRSEALRVVDTGTLAGLTASACHRGSLVGITDGSSVSRARLVNGTIESVASNDTMPRGVSTFVSTRMEVVGDTLYIVDNRNDVKIWNVAEEAPRYVGRYTGVPGDAFPLGDGYMLHADATEGRIVDLRDPRAPSTILVFRLRRGNTVTGVRGGARRGDDLVLLANEGFEFHRFSWADVLAAASRTDLPSNILEDWYPVQRQLSRHERRSVRFEGGFMVANTVGDPTMVSAVKKEALPAVIDPLTGQLLTDEGRSQQGNNEGRHYEHAAFVRPVPRGGEWFQIGPGLNGLWPEIVHVDLAAMVKGANAEQAVTPILMDHASEYTDLCWFPDERFGYTLRQHLNQPWAITRWERAR